MLSEVGKGRKVKVNEAGKHAIQTEEFQRKRIKYKT